MERDYLDNLSLAERPGDPAADAAGDRPRRRRLLAAAMPDARPRGRDRQPRRRRAAAALPALAATSTRASGEMRVTVVDSGSPDCDAGDGRARVPRGAAAAPRQHRLLGRQQPRPARERAPTPCCCSTPTPRSTPGRSTPPWRGCARTRGSGWSGCKLVTESGELDHACKRSFPTPLSALAHFTGIGRGERRPGRAQPVPGDPPRRRRAGRGRRRQRRLHALPRRGGARGRPARRGLLALHGGPRLVPPLLGGGLEGLLRARRRSPSTSRAAPAAAAGARGRRSPSTAAWAASTAASTPPSTTRS